VASCTKPVNTDRFCILYTYINNYFVGLSIEYKDTSSGIGQWLKWIFGLLLLNAEEVRESFIKNFISVVLGKVRLKKNL